MARITREDGPLYIPTPVLPAPIARITDPIATLRAFLLAHFALVSFPAITVALAELERRARIEARRDEYLAAHPALRIQHAIEVGYHWVGFYSIGTHPPVGYAGPDYHTALEAALNAGGAP